MLALAFSELTGVCIAVSQITITCPPAPSKLLLCSRPALGVPGYRTQSRLFHSHRTGSNKRTGCEPALNSSITSDVFKQNDNNWLRWPLLWRIRTSFMFEFRFSAHIGSSEKGSYLSWEAQTCVSCLLPTMHCCFPVEPQGPTGPDDQFFLPVL